MRLSKNAIKSFLILFAVFCMAFFVSCSKKEYRVGTGVPGTIADIPWSKYDEYIQKIKIMKNGEERDALLHKAENMLIDEYAYIPVDYNVIRSICKPYLKNIYIDKLNVPHIHNMRYDDGRTVANLQFSSEPQLMDPHLASYSNEIMFTSILFVRLFDYNENNQLVPYLVDTYSISEDQLTYDFKLKKGFGWSDGKELTAYDCEYGLKRACNPDTGNQYSFIISTIEGYPNDISVKAISDYELRIKLSCPCPYFLSSLANPTTAPLRKDIVENNKEWYLELPMVTSGPYYLSSWVHKSSFVFKKNPYFYDADSVEVSTVNLMLSSDETSVYNAYSISNIDFAMDIPDNIESDEFSYWEYENLYAIRFNTKHKIFEGFTREEALKIRQALAYCIDREYIADISNNLKKPSYNIISPVFDNYRKKSFVEDSGSYIYPHSRGIACEKNIDKARKLLTEVGFHFDDKGKIIEEFVFEMMALSENFTQLMVMQTDFDKLGIVMKIKKRDYGLIECGDYFAYYGMWGADYSDPLTMIEIFTSDNAKNFCFLGRELP